MSDNSNDDGVVPAARMPYLRLLVLASVGFITVTTGLVTGRAPSPDQRRLRHQGFADGPSDCRVQHPHGGGSAQGADCDVERFEASPADEDDADQRAEHVAEAFPGAVAAEVPAEALLACESCDGR